MEFASLIGHAVQSIVRPKQNAVNVRKRDVMATINVISIVRLLIGIQQNY